MATYYIIAATASTSIRDAGNVNGYPQVKAGLITAQPGDLFIVDNGFNFNTAIQMASGVTGAIEVRIEQSITGVTATNGSAITFGPGVSATVNIGAGVDADSVQLIAKGGGGLTVNAANGATVGQITGSSFVDAIHVGNGVTLNGVILDASKSVAVTAGDNVTFNSQVTINSFGTSVTLEAGDNATFNGNVTLPGNFGLKSVTLGDFATVRGTVTMTGNAVAGTAKEQIFTAGDNLTVTGAVVMNANYGSSTFQAGDFATIGTNLSAISAYNENLFVLGADSRVGGTISMSANYSDNDLSIGDRSIVGASGVGSIFIAANYSENCVAVGDFVTVKGEFNLGSNESKQLVQVGDNLTVTGSVVFGGANDQNGIEIGDNLKVGGSVMGSYNYTTGEYIRIGDNWLIGGFLTMGGGNDNLVLGQPGAGQQQIVVADAFGGSGLRVEAPAGKEAAFGTAATAAGWAQNSDGTWSPTKINQVFFFDGFKYQFLYFDKAADLAAAPDFSTCEIFTQPDVVVNGTNGADLMQILYSDSAGKKIDGSDGLNETINGFGGNDTINAGAGNDVVYGGDGDDRFVLTGSFGTDAFFGGSTGETVGDTLDASGLGGASVSYSATGAGTLTTGGGTATFAGIEALVLGGGADTVTGSAGTDIISAGGGDDRINSAIGADVLFGGDGNDLIVSTTDGFGTPDQGIDLVLNPDTDPFNDSDEIYGGAGSDTILSGDDGDFVDGGEGNDRIDSGIDSDIVFGGAGQDTVQGGQGGDLIYGGDGNDLIHADSADGNDAFAASDDTDVAPDNNDDEVYGGAGHDTIYGGDDTDNLFGDDGNDALFGGLDADVLNGGAGSNTLTGGGGADVFVFTPGETMVVTDFGTGSGSVNDFDQFNNDYIDLSPFYTDLAEAVADFEDDKLLNQSIGDYSDNQSMMGGSIRLLGVTSAALTFDSTNLF